MGAIINDKGRAAGRSGVGAVMGSKNLKAIVVGTSGKSVLDRVLIGSVSEYVVRNSNCTVIVVK
jgi:aldehyde:ferredoxin oxidoreductase